MKKRVAFILSLHRKKLSQVTNDLVGYTATFFFTFCKVQTGINQEISLRGSERTDCWPMPANLLAPIGLHSCDRFLGLIRLNLSVL